MEHQQLSSRLAWAVLVLLSCSLQVFGQDTPEQPTEAGTAFVVDPKGFLLTSLHVIEKAVKIEVYINGKIHEAKVVAKDEKRRLVILQVKAKGLPSLPLGDSESIKVGEELLSVGLTTQASLAPKVTGTKGVVTAVSTVEDPVKFKADTPLNPLLSGGPLVNDRGEVVGLVDIPPSENGPTTTGIAIPINAVKDLLRTKEVEWPAEAAQGKMEMTDLLKRTELGLAQVRVIVPESVEEEPKKDPGKTPAEEKQPEGPPNSLWVSPEEMAEMTARLEANQKPMDSLDKEELQSLATEALGAIYLLQGLDLKENKLAEEAVVYLKKASALRPDSALTHAMLAAAAKEAGDKELSAAELAQARKLIPKSSTTRKSAASKIWIPRSEVEALRLRLDRLTGDKDPAKTEALLPAVKRAGAMFAVWKGDYRWGRGVLPLAEAEYNRALSLDPECPEALAAGAYISDKRGDPLTAQERLKRAFYADPKNPRILSAIQDFVLTYRKDFLPPSIEIVSPKQGEKIPVSKTNHLVFVVKDDLGKVYDVEVFLDKTSLMKKFGPGRYDLQWSSLGFQYTKPTIRITAVDAAGNKTEAKVTVDVGAR